MYHLQLVVLIVDEALMNYRYLVSALRDGLLMNYLLSAFSNRWVVDELRTISSKWLMNFLLSMVDGLLMNYLLSAVNGLLMNYVLSAVNG